MVKINSQENIGYGYDSPVQGKYNYGLGGVPVGTNYGGMSSPLGIGGILGKSSAYANIRKPYSMGANPIGNKMYGKQSSSYGRAKMDIGSLIEGNKGLNYKIDLKSGNDNKYGSESKIDVYVIDTNALIGLYNAMVGKQGLNGNGNNSSAYGNSRLSGYGNNLLSGYGNDLQNSNRMNNLYNSTAGKKGSTLDKVLGNYLGAKGRNGAGKPIGYNPSSNVAYLLIRGDDGIGLNEMGFPMANGYMTEDDNSSGFQLPIGIYKDGVLYLTNGDGINPLVKEGALDKYLGKDKTTSKDAKYDLVKLLGARTSSREYRGASGSMSN